MSDLNPYHPLFQLQDGQSEDEFGPPVDDNTIAQIEVTRTANGRQEEIPETPSPEELRSLQDIATRWGGGQYVLRARTVRGRIYASRRFSIPGTAKPLAPTVETQQQAPAGVDMAALGASGGQLPIILAVMQMMQQGQQAQTQLTLAMMTQQTQVLVAALGGRDNAAAANTGAMATIAGKLLEARTSAPAAAPVDVVRQTRDLIGLTKELAAAGTTETETGQLMQFIAGVVGAMVAAKQEQAPAQPPPQTVTVEATPAQQPPTETNGAGVPQHGAANLEG